MTLRQREVFAEVFAATRDRTSWFRAKHPGQRVTLASLSRAGVLVRRAWRGIEGEADAAHEYQVSTVALAALKSVTP